MPRPKKLIRPIAINLKLPEDLVAQIQLELYSETLGKVPQGAIQGFFESLSREYFAKKALAVLQHANALVKLQLLAEVPIDGQS